MGAISNQKTSIFQNIFIFWRTFQNYDASVFLANEEFQLFNRSQNENMDSRELINRCRQHDELAWEVLVRQHQGRICAIAYGYLGDQDEASDLAQEIFVRIYQRLESCDEPDRFEAWMTRIARNACIDHLRRIKARPPRQDIPADEMHNLAGESSNPEQDWVRNKRKKMVFRALQELSEINREIILMKDIQELSLDEIAQMLNVPVGTVKSRSNRARIELAKVIAGYDDGPDGNFRAGLAS